MRRLLSLLFALLSWNAHAQSLAQAPPLRLPVRTFTADDGLGGATITSLLKDARGFLWIGTPDELLLYDGTRFQPFRYTDRSGASQAFRRAYLFSLGQYGVFIAHEEGTHQFITPSGQLRKIATPFSDFSVRGSMQAEGRSAIFRASTSGHSGRYDAKSCRWLEVKKQPLPHLSAIRVTPAGKTMLGSDTGASARGLYLLERGSAGLGEAYKLPFRARAALSLAEGTIFIDDDDSRALWWMPAGGTAQPLTRMHWGANELCAVYVGDSICYLAAGHTVLRFTPASGRVEEILREDGTPLVRSGVLTHIAADGRTLWVGSNTSGLIQVLLDGPRLRHLRTENPILNWSHGIHADLARGRIYVGGYSGTVAVFDTAGDFIEDLTPTLRRAGGVPSAYINAIDPTPDGRLLIVSGHNLWLYNPTTQAAENLLPGVEAAKRAHDIDPKDYQGRSGVLRAGPWEWWMSEKVGLVRWRILPTQQPGSARVEIMQVLRIAPPAPEAICSYAGVWWCATAGRLYKFDATGLRDSFRYPITAFATCLVPDAKGRLWIGTESGIAVWRAGTVERILTSDDGLPNNHIYALLPDNAGRMWGSTNGGLFALRTDDFSVRAFTSGDGLQGAEFNLGAQARDARGRLYFGGMNGVNIVEPAVALREEAASPVTVTRVAGADTVYHAYPGAASPATLRLPHDRASLTIAFTAPRLEAAGPLRFEYRLHEDDSVWTDNGTRRELQLFLAPGDYRVELRVRGQPATVAGFSVVVAPPFYRRWWFIAALILGASAVAIAGIQRASRRRYQRKLLALETARHIQEEKERISRELHDELGARAALLSHNASLLKEAEAQADIIPLTARITETTADMLTALRETVWTLKQESITAESLWLRYKNFIAKLGATYDHIHFVVEEDTPLPGEPMDYARALHLLRILQEATMNAVKHSGAATITAAVRLLEGRACFFVADDGTGFDVEAARESGEGNGLYNMTHRSAEASIYLRIRSSPGAAGTEVAACL